MTEEFEIKFKGELHTVAANTEYFPSHDGDWADIEIVEVFDLDNNVIETSYEDEELIKERIFDKLKDMYYIDSKEADYD